MAIRSEVVVRKNVGREKPYPKLMQDENSPMIVLCTAYGVGVIVRSCEVDSHVVHNVGSAISQPTLNLTDFTGTIQLSNE